jgi:hypothetical protein
LNLGAGLYRTVARRALYEERPANTLRRLNLLSNQSFGYCPSAKRSRSNTRAAMIRNLFETAHKAIASLWQPGTYIRSCELSSVLERAHSNVARKTKGWLEHENRHAGRTREA